MVQQAAFPGIAYEERHASRASGWEVKLAFIGTVLLLLLTTQSLQFLFADSNVEGLAKRATARDNPIYLAMFAMSAGLFGLLAIRHVLTRGPSGRLAAGVLIGMLVGASALWSIGQRSTMIYASVFIILLTASYAMAMYLRPRVFLQIYFWVTTAILTASFGLLIFAPELAGEMRYGGGWLTDRQFSGVMASKNLAGYVFVSTFLLALHGRTLGLWLTVRLVVGAMALLAIVLSNSATAVMILAILAPLSVIIPMMPRFGPQFAFIAVCGFLVLAFAIPFIDVGGLVDVIGRDSTFTGRAQLWELALTKIQERPFLGYGYWGFFSADPYSPAWAFWENFQYFVTDTFHNSAIDIAISLGFVGLGVLCATVIFAAKVVFNQSEDLNVRLLLVWLLAIYVIGSAMEFAIFHHNYVATVVTFYTLFAAGQTYREEAA